MVDDPDLRAAVRHTLLFTALFVPASILLGMLIAVALNRRSGSSGSTAPAIFVPFVASAAATGILANFVFNPQFGVANNALRVLRLPQQQFLESPHQALLVICLIALWGEVGFTVGRSTWRRCRTSRASSSRRRSIDGASRLQVFWHVTLPQLRAGHRVRRGLADHHGDPAVRPRLHDDPRRAAAARPQTVVYYVYDQAFQTHRTSATARPSPTSCSRVTMLITVGMIWYSRRRARWRRSDGDRSLGTAPT